MKTRRELQREPACGQGTGMGCWRRSGAHRASRSSSRGCWDGPGCKEYRASHGTDGTLG